MTRTLTLERQILMGSLPTMPKIYALFTRKRLEWMARDVGRYSEELVREFDTSYVATLPSYIDRQAATTKQAPLEYIRDRGKRVDISLPAIRRYQYGENVDSTKTPLTFEFNYHGKWLKIDCS